MITLSSILLVLAFGCFALSAIWNPGPPRPHLVSTGLALWTLAELVSRINH